MNPTRSSARRNWLPEMAVGNFATLPAQGQLDEFVPGFRGNGVSSGDAVFHIEFRSLPDTG
jgi:hypothetical protein